MAGFGSELLFLDLSLIQSHPCEVTALQSVPCLYHLPCDLGTHDLEIQFLHVKNENSHDSLE